MQKSDTRGCANRLRGVSPLLFSREDTHLVILKQFLRCENSSVGRVPRIRPSDTGFESRSEHDRKFFFSVPCRTFIHISPIRKRYECFNFHDQLFWSRRTTLPHPVCFVSVFGGLMGRKPLAPKKFNFLTARCHSWIKKVPFRRYKRGINSSIYHDYLFGQERRHCDILFVSFVFFVVAWAEPRHARLSH